MKFEEKKALMNLTLMMDFMPCKIWDKYLHHKTSIPDKKKKKLKTSI